MRACLGCGKPVAKGSRCPSCKRANIQRRKSQGLTGERGSTHASRQRRQNVLKRARHECFYCGDRATIADHFVPLSRGGSDTEENLVAACRLCNQRKADKMPREFLREIRRGHRAGRIVVLVGPPGSGKTTIARLLADRLHLPFASVDDFGDTGQRRWKELLRWMGERSDAIIEANVIQAPFARLLGSVDHTVIRLDAPRETRAGRLAQRGDPPVRIRRMLEHRPTIYTYPPDSVIGTAGMKAEEVVRRCEEVVAQRRDAA